MTRLPRMAIYVIVGRARKGCSYCAPVLCKKQVQLVACGG